MIAIVDSGGANLTSVINAINNLGYAPELTSDPDRIAKSSKVLLPGVGAAACAMDRLKRAALDACLKELKQPVLGICLGMQLLFESSEEGPTKCLGVIPGKVRRMEPGIPPPRLLPQAGEGIMGGSPERLTIPHMGWNQVVYESAPSPLFKGIRDGEFFYFVHSYAAEPGPWVTACCDYGGKVAAAVGHRNFFGVQFHPERSSKAGSRLLSNFLAL